MAKLALKVVESAPFYTEEVELWSEDRSHDAHSLHYAISYPEALRPEIPAYFIKRYTQRGDVVLDPFCGSGTTPLEANLSGRIAFACDVNPLSMRITNAKLDPADITQVTLKLQLINLNRPVNLSHFNEYFAPFYDVATFRELVNIKQALQIDEDPSARFVELMVLSILHGHSAGFLSAYSFPQIALSPSEQEQLNIKRCQTPDYRAVVPRVLRKTAAVMRDGIPSILLQMERRNRLAVNDARDLSYIANDSVDLVVTAPPLPGSIDLAEKLWLRNWFAGVSTSTFEEDLFQSTSLEDWLDFMNGVLLELARVVKPGQRAVFALRRLKLNGRVVALDDELYQLVEDQLSRFWEPECMLLARERSAKLKDCLKERNRAKARRQSRLLVLRRR